MFRELTPDQYESVLPLFAGFDYSLSLHAAVQGRSLGRIFVDDPRQPRTAFALTVEGYLLAGEYDNPRTLQALKQLWEEKIFTGQVYVNGDESMSLAVHPAEWEDRLPELVPTHLAEKLLRYHYLCTDLAYDWRSNLPAGYEIHRIDRQIWRNDSLIFPEQIGSWEEVQEYWGTEENFLDNGVGFFVLQDGQIVASCMSDCAAGEQIDIGIVTLGSHRRKGLSSAVTAATVEYCLLHGFKRIGWHCNAENVASWKTAEKVGFIRQREYFYYFYIYDPIDHLAELGWYHYRNGDPLPAVEYYEQVFALRQDNPDYYYHVAALAWASLGHKENALKYLNAAADHGWRHASFTQRQTDFTLLHGLPEWEKVLERMQ
ncbi:MAG: GNAT family N-acetyltransferase [Anaerolineales bacterium]|nr:GNAT family N-acetyltransferase [Anaerolineales bacterium]